MAEPKPTMLDPENDNFDLDEFEQEKDASGDVPEDLTEEIILTGTVEGKGDDHATVDLGNGLTGILPFDQLHEGSISVGDEMFVKVKELNYEDDAPLLSEREAVADRAWQMVAEAHREDKFIEGTIFKKIKGGFLVKLFDEITAFMPHSHLSLRRKQNYDKYMDREFEMKVLEYDRDDDNVVVSRRERLEELRQKEQKTFFQEKEKGEWVTGTVKNIVNFGAFINLGPVDGLLHKSDVAWGSVRDVNDYLTLGEEVEVQILSMTPDEGKVSLGLKQKYPDPWEDIEEKYEPGQETTGEIVDVWSDGVFVRLEQDVEGKVPEDELAWATSWEHPEDQFHKEEKMKVKIMEIDSDRRRMTLSRKRTGADPWEILRKRFPEGTVLSAPVVDITKDFINVQLLQNVKGIIHRSNIQWGDEEMNLFDRFEIGQKVKCKILNLDAENQVVELGIKQTMPDPWVQKAQDYPEGTTTKGTVTSVLQFGAFVRLDDDLEGLVHVSEMSGGKRVNPFEVVSEGDEVGVKVIGIDTNEHKIDLSIQGYREEQQKQDAEEFLSDGSPNDGNMTMGDMFGDDLKNFVTD